jgi:uncharacterized phage protein (predicted DNA packaging)
MADIVVTELGPLYTLEEVKQHLNVDFPDDDVIIQAYMDAAEKAVLQYCNISLVPVGTEAVFKVAAMLTVSDFYASKGAITSPSSEGIPHSSRRLVDPYRWLRV